VYQNIFFLFAFILPQVNRRAAAAQKKQYFQRKYIEPKVRASSSTQKTRRQKQANIMLPFRLPAKVQWTIIDRKNRKTKRNTKVDKLQSRIEFPFLRSSRIQSRAN
jgi:hypothetical protein